MFKPSLRALIAGCALACLAGCGGSKPPAAVESASNQVLNVYNWPDYIADDTIRNFEAQTGIKVNYQVYSSNDAMLAQLEKTPDGFDVIFPSAHPYAVQMIQRGQLKPLEKSRLTNLRHVDASIAMEIGRIDPGNDHLVPYLWGTTGIGANVAKVRAALGPDAAIDSWSVLFDPNTARKLSDCGIGILDDNQEVFSAMLMWLGRSPDDYSEEAIAAVKNAYREIRPFVRHTTDSSQLIDALANGDLCVALMYSGDVAQAKDKAAERADDLSYAIPREGALRWMDVAAIPKDAKNVENAHRFLQYLMEPETIAAITNKVAYANANTASTRMIESSIAKNPGIYPPAELRAKLRIAQPATEADSARRMKAWESMIRGL